MSAPRRVSGGLLALAISTMVVSIIGLIAAIIVNIFVLDDYNAYGEVPVPGDAVLHLPTGEANITFRTYAVGSGSGGLPIPKLSLTIDPPPGVSDPKVTENYGSTTSVNNDMRRRVWVVDVPAAGDYRIHTDGQVSAFIEPRLAFGHSSSYGWVPWLFGALLGLSVIGFVLAIVARLRVDRTPVPAPAIGTEYVPSAPTEPYVPDDEGVRIQQLKTLAALRDSGALTEQEFEAEKRRVLGGL